MFLTLVETKQAITNMHLFKEINLVWQRVRVVITDKDFTERSVFSEQIHFAVMYFIKRSPVGLRPGE